MATGDNWTGIMFDCMVMPPDCDKAAGTCGSYLAIPFFLSFVLLISVILLNLFTAVIIETFEKTHEQEEWKLSPQVGPCAPRWDRVDGWVTGCSACTSTGGTHEQEEWRLSPQASRD